MQLVSNVVPVINYIILFVLITCMFILYKTKWDLVEDTIKSTSESPSQKRLTIFLCVALLILLSLIGVLLHIEIPAYIWYGNLSLITVGLGLAVGEKIALNNKTTSSTTITPDSITQDTSKPAGQNN